MTFFYILLDDITISILLEHMNLDIYDIKSHEFSTWVAQLICYSATSR